PDDYQVCWAPDRRDLRRAAEDSRWPHRAFEPLSLWNRPRVSRDRGRDVERNLHGELSHLAKRLRAARNAALYEYALAPARVAHARGLHFRRCPGRRFSRPRRNSTVERPRPDQGAGTAGAARSGERLRR